MRKKNKILLITLGILAGIIIAGGISYYIYIRSKIYNNSIYDIKGITYDENEKEEEPEVSYSEVQGITNILLVGIDARDINEPSRSDAILIATIDNNNKNLKFTSIMRDSYVEIKGLGETKINAAYAKGGIGLLIDTIERNFNLELDKYVVVNFLGFQDIVDALGGIEVNIKDYEIDEMNKYIGEVNENKSPKIESAGVNHLDGQRALAYTRIRKVGDGSYERTKRQREVMRLIAYKVMDLNVIQYPNILGKISDYIKTNIEPINIINYGYTVSKFQPLNVEELQIPLNELSEGRVYKGSWVLLMDKKQNSKILLNFILNNTLPSEKDINKDEFKKELDRYLKIDKPYKKPKIEKNKEKNKESLEIKTYKDDDSIDDEEYNDYDVEETTDFQ
ncbi:LCP family protein [Clostridium hydrogeniformans]|uniref:LCP family protein n=1 Tax=Clostridium hydrogeniformans TaxID=349933 RepID=UPI0006922063|nr:LCP family protein [Clostridium hydrogeniformans]